MAKSKEPHRLRIGEAKLTLDRYERQDSPQIRCVRCHEGKPKGIEVSGHKGTDFYMCDDCVCRVLYYEVGSNAFCEVKGPKYSAEELVVKDQEVRKRRQSSKESSASSGRMPTSRTAHRS